MHYSATLAAALHAAATPSQPYPLAAWCRSVAVEQSAAAAEQSAVPAAAVALGRLPAFQSGIFDLSGCTWLQAGSQVPRHSAPAAVATHQGQSRSAACVEQATNISDKVSRAVVCSSTYSQRKTAQHCQGVSY